MNWVVQAQIARSVAVYAHAGQTDRSGNFWATRTALTRLIGRSPADRA